MSATKTQDTPPSESIDSDLSLVLPGRGVPIASGWKWIGEGWDLFKRAPLMWIMSIFILFVAALVCAFIPIIGALMFQLLQAVFLGGYVVACRELEKGAGGFELEHLFAGFSRRFVPLMILGLLVLVGWVLIMLVFMVFAGFGLLTAYMAGDSESLAALGASAGALMIGTLVAAGLSVPLMAAYWFAPALIMMHNMSPLAAMKESMFACFRNIFPFLLYGAVMFVLGILAVIPFGLGLLIYVPLIITSAYAGYREIFTDA